jgi:capsular polysaccharide transport system permease protein
MSAAESRLQVVADAAARIPGTGDEPAVATDAPPRKRWRIGRLPWFLHPLFLLVVVLPTLASGFYYGRLAADVYIAESRFVLRTPERQVASPLGQFLRSAAGFGRAQDDSYAVQDFMLSRDALRALDERLALRKAFADPSIDILNRFAAIDGDDSFEALHLYYRKMVTIVIDSASSIGTLTTRAFTAEDAAAMNLLLLDLGEGLVNQLNTRGRADLIRFAAADVAEAEGRAKAAALALAEFRNREGVIDVDRQAMIALQQIAKLQEDMLASRAQISQLERVAPNNPQLQLLRERERIVGDEMARETAKLTGDSSRSFATKASEYTRLLLEKEFADRMLASTMASLDQARSEAQRKQTYLERIVQPARPDQAMEPRRLRAFAATVLAALLLWGVLKLLLASVREHMD